MSARPGGEPGLTTAFTNTPSSSSRFAIWNATSSGPTKIEIGVGGKGRVEYERAAGGGAGADDRVHEYALVVQPLRHLERDLVRPDEDRDHGRRGVAAVEPDGAELRHHEARVLPEALAALGLAFD